MSNQFTPGAATQIAHQCTVATTGDHPLSPSDTLKDYGVSGSPQVSLITTRIRTDGDIGLPNLAFDTADSALISDDAPERPRPGALAGFARENPTQAVVMSAAAGASCCDARSASWKTTTKNSWRCLSAGGRAIT